MLSAAARRAIRKASHTDGRAGWNPYNPKSSEVGGNQDRIGHSVDRVIRQWSYVVDNR